ncbi:DinB family protein [Nocardioides KLBMP 9356]|uniref:DinB family protein n=1 Tax=Nocardioides potassii TaxID=2911371 RepID=A0ABS9HIV1_9ACTN|nr:DinB family protein [Nocardioides potassii]MCF6380013.1 DinB family protein [Nocardioides potassii]
MSNDQITRDDLLSWLDSKRRHVVQQVEAMSPEARRSSCVPSGWTPLGLVHHLTHDVERVWLRAVMGGQQVDIPEGYEGWEAPADVSDGDVLEAYRRECGLADDAIADLPLDQSPAWWFEGAGAPPYSNLREVLLHVLVETSTHAGHLDICRELADGGQRLVLDVPD